MAKTDENLYDSVVKKPIALDELHELAQAGVSYEIATVLFLVNNNDIFKIFFKVSKFGTHQYERYRP